MITITPDVFRTARGFRSAGATNPIQHRESKEVGNPVALPDLVGHGRKVALPCDTGSPAGLRFDHGLP
jgi:hypothetical protein